MTDRPPRPKRPADPRGVESDRALFEELFDYGYRADNREVAAHLRELATLETPPIAKNFLIYMAGLFERYPNRSSEAGRPERIKTGTYRGGWQVLLGYELLLADLREIKRAAKRGRTPAELAERFELFTVDCSQPRDSERRVVPDEAKVRQWLAELAAPGMRPSTVAYKIIAGELRMGVELLRRRLTRVRRDRMRATTTAKK